MAETKAQKSSKSGTDVQTTDGQPPERDVFEAEATTLLLKFGDDFEGIANRDPTGLSDWQIRGWEPSRGAEPVVIAQVTDKVMEKIADAASDVEKQEPNEVEDPEAMHKAYEEANTPGEDGASPRGQLKSDDEAREKASAK